jgi:hypothetical protein
MASNFANGYAPRGWLDDPTSEAYLAAHGAAALETFGLWRETVKARYASTAPEDALVWIGEARQLARAPAEVTADYRLRLARSFEIHEDRTTKDAYRHALEPLGVDPANVVVWNDHEDTFLPATVPDVQWWSRVIVIVDCRSGPWTAPLWSGSAVWSDEEVWGIEGMTQIELAFLRSHIRRWKWAGAFPLGMAFIFDTFDLATEWKALTWVGAPINDVAVMPLGRVWGWNEAVYLSAPDLWSADEAWADVFTF